MGSIFSHQRANAQAQEAILHQVYDKASSADKSQLFLDYSTSRLGLIELQHRELLLANSDPMIGSRQKFQSLIHLAGLLISPFNVLLLVLSCINFATDSALSGTILLTMIVLSVITGFLQERKSSRAVEKLQKLVTSTSRVYRLIPAENESDYERSCTVVNCELQLDFTPDQKNFKFLISPEIKEKIQKFPELRELQTEENKANNNTSSRYLWIETSVPSNNLVKGDIIVLSAGDLVPADCRLITSKDLFVSQAAMTGESLPIEKMASVSPILDANKRSKETIFDKLNICLMGTTIVSGTATALILRTGRETYFGSIAKSVEGAKGKTSFDKGINRYILMMVSFMIIMGLLTLLINGFLKDDWTSAIQFALAVAVGLTPEMLPMVITVTLAKGAISMSKSKVIVKRLKSIQNFGAMNVLCTDKTGTLTEDEVVLEHYVDTFGQESLKVLECAFYNSYHQTGLKNLLDKAVIRRGESFNFPAKVKIDELPFDFQRRRMSVIISDNEDSKEHLLICKGAIEEVLSISQSILIREDQAQISEELSLARRKSVESIIHEAQSFEAKMPSLEITIEKENDSEDSFVDEAAKKDEKIYIPEEKNTKMIKRLLTQANRNEIIQVAHKLNESGLRTICVAIRSFEATKNDYKSSDESELTVVGFIAFLDPPKPSTAQALIDLQNAGISVKVLTGDNDFVAKAVCNQVGLKTDFLLNGNEIAKMKDEELSEAIQKTTVFCKLSPSQKERIVTILQKRGNVVGFMGDGINDGPAIKAADVGISVHNAVDIAKESADIILLEKSLLVLRKGVTEGRMVFGNIIKYIKMGSSSNFGNVFSVTGGSILLPFIPMQPVQLLFQNLLYDFSQVGIPFDSVDDEYTSKPRKWEIADIVKFMVFMGPVSSIFDYCTFALMWYYFGANNSDQQVLFQTGWFIEGLISQTLIVHVIRTRKIPFIQSSASLPLKITTLITISVAIALVYSPLGPFIPYTPLPGIYFAFLVGILLGYVILGQLIKSLYYRLFGLK